MAELANIQLLRCSDNGLVDPFIVHATAQGRPSERFEHHETQLSLGLNLIGKADVARVRRLIERAGLPLRGPALAPRRLMELMAGDKKAAQGKLRFVVLEALGRATLRGGVAEQRIREAIVAAAQ